MKKIISFTVLLGMILLGSSFTANEAPMLKWKKLGAKKVTYKLDKDVLHVGKYDGTFRKLKIKVTGGSINMHKMTVEYGNGSHDNIPLKYTFERGNNSRVIDLEGGKRIIKDITFWYDTKNSSNKRATVHVFGS